MSDGKFKMTPKNYTCPLKYENANEQIIHESNNRYSSPYELRRLRSKIQLETLVSTKLKASIRGARQGPVRKAINEPNNDQFEYTRELKEC